MKRRQFFGVTFLALTILSCADTLLLVQPAQGQTGKGTIDALVKTLAGLQINKSGISSPQLAEVAKYIDYQTMAEQALGNKEWQQLNTTQRKIYLQSFKSLVEHRYYKRWHKIFSKSKIAYENEDKTATRKDNEIMVKTALSADKDTKMVIWTLTAQQPKVINLAVDDRDILNKVQSRFQGKIARAGVPAFLAWLQNKAKQSSDTDEDNLSAEDNRRIHQISKSN